MRRRVSGTVWVRALVDETGAVTEVTLDRASPTGLGFEDAAMRSVRTRVYRPGTKRGVPVRVWLPIAVEFTFRATDR
jgi:TonB family protein